MTTPDLGDEFTELVDAHIPRVDLVDKAANGTRFLIAKNQGGLLGPDLVRELVTKAEPEQASPAAVPAETVTMTGSPAAIAKLIHQAALRHDGVAKAEMSAADINDLPDSAFAYIEPGGHKDDDGKTVPRSLRHFPINDEAHVRNALSRAPQSPFGDEAMPKIRAAAKKFGIEVAKEAQDMDEDILDPMTALAEPEQDMSGMPTDPGSPAWEAIDAATAYKWTAILARAKHAIDILAEREMLEAAAGDPDDAMQAMDLQDACCAIDYAISILAPFAVAEQAEAECGEEMAAVGKALSGFDASPLDTIEALATVTKAGRTLSAANEAAIRDAVDSLQKVLASLPAAPATEEVAKTANEEPNMPEPTLSEDVTADSGQEPAMGVQEPLEKASSEKTPMVAVYDNEGNLVGIVDPSEITPISGAGPKKDDTSDGDAEEADAVPETPDLEPAPAAEVGTPADAVPDNEDDVAKSTTDNTPSDDVLKSIAKTEATAVLNEYSATQEQVIAKQAADLAQLASTVEVLKAQVQALEEQPAMPKVFTNGAVPPSQHLRGMGDAAPSIDVAKAREMKQGMYAATDATEQKRIADQMQAAAIARLQNIHYGA